MFRHFWLCGKSSIPRYRADNHGAAFAIGSLFLLCTILLPPSNVYDVRFYFQTEKILLFLSTSYLSNHFRNLLLYILFSYLILYRLFPMNTSSKRNNNIKDIFLKEDHHVNQKSKSDYQQILRVLQVLVRPDKYVHKPPCPAAAYMDVRLSCKVQVYEKSRETKGGEVCSNYQCKIND